MSEQYVRRPTEPDGTYTYYRDFTAEGKATVIAVANRWIPSALGVRLDGSNIDAMLDRADAISRHRLKTPLGPFWFISPQIPYDTPYSGWASLRDAMQEAKRSSK